MATPEVCGGQLHGTNQRAQRSGSACALAFSRKKKRELEIIIPENTYVKKPMPSSSATRRLGVLPAYVFSVLERSDACFLKALP